MPCFSCLTTARRVRSRQKTQKIFFSLAACAGDSHQVMNSLQTAPVRAKWIRVLSPDVSHATVDRKQELGFFLILLSVRHNAQDRWGQQSLNLRLCKAAKKNKWQESRLRKSKHSHIPQLLWIAASWVSHQTSLPRTQSAFESHWPKFTPTYCWPKI